MTKSDCAFSRMYWSFVIGHSSFVRHSDFVIRTLPTGCRGNRRISCFAPFAEQVHEQTVANVAIATVAAESFDPKKPTQLILYALPNGNSIKRRSDAPRPRGAIGITTFNISGADAPCAIDKDENVVIADLEATADGIGKTWPVGNASTPTPRSRSSPLSISSRSNSPENQASPSWPTAAAVR